MRQCAACADPLASALPRIRVEIPEMEFEISADGKRKIDSIYNHICAAVWNLGQHVNTAGAGMLEDHKWVLHWERGCSRLAVVDDLGQHVHTVGAGMLDEDHNWVLQKERGRSKLACSDECAVMSVGCKMNRHELRMPAPWPRRRFFHGLGNGGCTAAAASLLR